MKISANHHPPNLSETWERFKSARGRELQNWVEAERALADARLAGDRDSEPGDRLLAAEAALQSAIVDFAASEDGASDPTSTALGLLRLAEHVLEEETDIGVQIRLPKRRTGRERRRQPRSKV